MLISNNMTAATPALIVSGFTVAVAGAFSRSYVRTRLRDSGYKLKVWVTVMDELRYSKVYLSLANDRGLPAWPAFLAVCWMPIAFALIVLGLTVGK